MGYAHYMTRCINEEKVQRRVHEHIPDIIGEWLPIVPKRVTYSPLNTNPTVSYAFEELLQQKCDDMTYTV
jgi:hypothetical protein